MSLQIYEEKWSRKTRNARNRWVEAVRNPATIEAYVTQISRITGLPVDTVRSSEPAQEFANFARNIDNYVSKWVGGIESAVAGRKWSQRYVEAFKRTTS
ncbi:MAG: hypothetical protein QXT86_09855 [Archaeoglobaceae archaeon]